MTKNLVLKTFLLFLSAITTCFPLLVVNTDQAIAAPINKRETNFTSPKGISPVVVDNSSNIEVLDPLDEQLSQARIILIDQEIDNNLADKVIAQLLYMSSGDQPEAKAPIYLYIDSSGGSVAAGLAIYDTIEMIDTDVITVNIGMAYSMAALLLASGKKGQRFGLDYSQTMIHQAIVGTPVQATDVEIEIQQKEILYQTNYLNELLANFTGKSVAQIVADTQQDLFMSAQESKEYGLIDQILPANQLPNCSHQKNLSCFLLLKKKIAEFSNHN